MIKALLSAIFFSLCLLSITAQEENPCDQGPMPFGTDARNLTIWNGEDYEPFFVKGINLGVAVPGTSPGNLAATTEEYYRWFGEIKEAGFNCIRTYTLHYPRFYQALDSFNTQNPNTPLFLLMGIWLEEELPGYDQDLYSLSDTFQFNARLAIDVMHGNGQVEPRPGKASGTFDTDISEWVMGIIMGREVFPEEIRKTNEDHTPIRTYEGAYLDVSTGEPATIWMTQQMDLVLEYQMDAYGTQRPMSFSSWPTLDPMDHTFIPEVSFPNEDSASFDLTVIDHRRATAGIFASFHAYPYYPPFVSNEPDYLNEEDRYGPNAYIGYLKDLRDYHSGMPMVIAEFGTPSSWGNARFSQSGMNHGGLSEAQTGQNGLRMFQNFADLDLAGGCYFSWIDEWFKVTWITDDYDYPLGSRLNWHNVMAAEQNFGLVKYVDTRDVMRPYTDYTVVDPIVSVEAGAGYSFFNIDMLLQQPIDADDTLWVAFDTYESGLGESILPNGDSIANRAEFALAITQDEALMYVTESYDLYGIFWGLDYKFRKGQLYRTIRTDGKPWVEVTWRNDEFDDNAVQIAGRIGVAQGVTSDNSLDGVFINGNEVNIRIPWGMINFVDPNNRMVVQNNPETSVVGPGSVPEQEQTSGIKLAFVHKGQLHEGSEQRFSWLPWGVPTDYAEVKKASYFIFKDSLGQFENPLIAKCDYYEMETGAGQTFQTSIVNGVLSNDFLLDGAATITASLIDPPSNGEVQLSTNGTFTYVPNIDEGIDRFTYRAQTADKESSEIEVNLVIGADLSNPNPGGEVDPEENDGLAVFPNPGDQEINLVCKDTIDYYHMVNSLGQQIRINTVGATSVRINTSQIKEGLYWITCYARERIMTEMVVVEHD